MKVSDTLILEDRVSSAIKHISNAMENSAASAELALNEVNRLKKVQEEWKTTLTQATNAKIKDNQNIDEARKKYNEASEALYKADKEYLKYSKQVINAEKQLDKFKQMQNQVNDTIDKSQQSVNKLTGLYAGIGSAIGNIAGNLLMQAGQMLKNSIGEAINTASDLVEVQNVVDVAFKGSAEEINKWSKTALTQYGLNELSAKQFAGTMGAMLKSSGLAGDSVVQMSKDIAGLAGDMASFYNLDPSEAFTKLRSGISGETEPLKQLGINMSVANLEAFALSQGIKESYNKMSQATQMTLRYKYLMKATADAQGDFSRTSKTFANQQRILNENWKRLTSTLATGFLPILTNLYIAMNNLINYTLENIPKIINIIGTLAIFITTSIAMIIPYLIALKSEAIVTFVTMQAQAIAAAAKTAAAWLAANAPILIALAIIGTVSVALNAMGLSFKEQAKNIITSFFMIGNVIQNVGILVANFFRSIFNGIINTINLVRKLKGEATLEKKQYTAFKDVYWDSVASTDKLIAKVKGFSQPNVSGASNVMDKFADGGALKTKQQGKIELKEEDIELLSQLATRDWTIRSQTLAPNIQFGAVTVNENADIGQFINELNNSVAEMVNSNANVGVGK